MRVNPSFNFCEAVKFAVLALAPPGQCGSGMHVGSTDLCHMFVAQAFCMARARKVSCGMLYIDLVNAFSQVIRRIVLQDLPESQEQWMRHLRNIGSIDEEATQTMSAAMTAMDWKDQGVSTHTLALLKTILEPSWFSIDGLAGLTLFWKGACAGTSPANLIFILAISVVIRRIEKKLLPAGITKQLNTLNATD